MEGSSGGSGQMRRLCVGRNNTERQECDTGKARSGKHTSAWPLRYKDRDPRCGGLKVDSIFFPKMINMQT